MKSGLFFPIVCKVGATTELGREEGIGKKEKGRSQPPSLDPNNDSCPEFRPRKGERKKGGSERGRAEWASSPSLGSIEKPSGM